MAGTWTGFMRFASVFPDLPYLIGYVRIVSFQKMPHGPYGAFSVVPGMCAAQKLAGIFLRGTAVSFREYLAAPEPGEEKTGQ